MNLHDFILIKIAYAAVRGSAAVRAVRAALCSSSAHNNMCAVHAAVCGNVLGSVWQCARQCAAVRQCSSLQQCAALCGSVRQCGCAAVCGSVRQCGLACAALLRQCAAVCSSAAVRVCQWALPVWGTVWQCVAVRMVVCVGALYAYIHEVACTRNNIHIGMPLQGGGNEPHLPRLTIILTDRQNELLYINTRKPHLPCTTYGELM
jgi:hypothetical protein